MSIYYPIVRRTEIECQKMKIKHILVTGGAGYIGSTLSRRLLAGGYQVTVLDSLRSGGASLLETLGESHFNFIKGDIRDAKTIQEALKEIDVIVHLAAIVGQPACSNHPEEAYEVNQVATINLFNKATEMKIQKFIFASSCSNYGMLEGAVATEETQVEPTSIYASTKVASEKYLLDSKASSTRPTVLRLATAFGLSPKMRMDLLIHEFLRDAICKNQILVFGPEYWRPFVHVKDVARAIISCIESPLEKVSYQIFNVGGNQNNIRKMDLAKLITKYVPNTELKFIKTETDLRNYRVSFDKISKTFGYSITRTLDDGIAEVKQAIERGVIDPYDKNWYYNP